MRLKRVHVKNFRAIQDETIDLGAHTALLGSNGTGKSTILRAIDRFYGASTSVELDDFYGRDANRPIEIELTFTDFLEMEKELFASRIHNNELSVVRIFDSGGGRGNGKYYGLTSQNPNFSGIRAGNSATEKTLEYNKIRELPVFSSMPRVRRAAEIDPILEDWERDHPEQCSLARDDGQFFGFQNVARGNLRKATSFVFIPAVRDATADALDSRGSVIAQLMELVVRSAIQRRSEIQAFQADVSERYKQLTDPENLTELGSLSSELTETLKHFYENANVNIKWKESEDLTLPLPGAEVLLGEDGFEGPVDRKGHGLQRAFILSLLQHLARAVALGHSEGADEWEEADYFPPDSAESIGHQTESQANPQVLMPGLILAIEEPELYQHPTKQRHFARVLSALSDGSLPGVASQTQIVFASHSSLFVSMERFDEIRLARREMAQETGHRECRFSQTNLARVAELLEDAWARARGSLTAETLRPRLHIINSEVSEGLFADLVVLVEGPDDKAALQAISSSKQISLEARGIAVLPVGGKSNLDKPAAIFKALGIPVFVIWDCDKKGENIRGVDTNKVLQRLMGCRESEIFESATKVSSNFACFENNLEEILRVELGERLFEDFVDRAKAEFGIEGRSDAQKVPAVMSSVFESAHEEGLRCTTLENIIDAILKLQDSA